MTPCLALQCQVHTCIWQVQQDCMGQVLLESYPAYVVVGPGRTFPQASVELCPTGVRAVPGVFIVWCLPSATDLHLPEG